MIGYFGPIKFETSDRRILTFTDFQRESTTRSEKHDVIGRKPVKEFIGPDLDTITFTITLTATSGVNPRVEAEKWLRMSRNGEAHPLVIGKRGLGFDRWTIESVSQMWDVVLNKGQVYSAKVDITLEEYHEVI